MFFRIEPNVLLHDIEAFDLHDKYESLALFETSMPSSAKISVLQGLLESGEYQMWLSEKEMTLFTQHIFLSSLLLLTTA